MITLSPQIVITLIIHLRNVTIPALVGYPQIALAEIQKNLYRINDDPTFDHLELCINSFIRTRHRFSPTLAYMHLQFSPSWCVHTRAVSQIY